MLCWPVLYQRCQTRTDIWSDVLSSLLIGLARVSVLETKDSNNIYAPILSHNSFILLLNNHFSCVTAADANRTFLSVTPSHWKLSSGRHLLWSITMWTVLLVVVYSMFYKPAHPQPFLKVHNVCASMVKLLLTAQLSSDFPSSILKQRNIHRYLKAVKPVFS